MPVPQPERLAALIQDKIAQDPQSGRCLAYPVTLGVMGLQQEVGYLSLPIETTQGPEGLTVHLDATAFTADLVTLLRRVADCFAELNTGSPGLPAEERSEAPS